MSKKNGRDGERRTGWDRRGVLNRRKGDRRKASVPVPKNRRKADERRTESKPRSGSERREIPDRRSSAWNVLEGS